MRFIALLTILLALAASFPVQARPEARTPCRFTINDSYQGFIGPTVKTPRAGRFDVSVGESHEGDPGFGDLPKGSPFEITIALYHLEPNRPGLPYVSTYVTLAKGRYGVSITPTFKGVKTFRWKGGTFQFRLLKASPVYGKGRTVVEVRAL